MAGEIDDNKMPLLDHLVELRQRLLYSVAALIVVFLVCFYFAGGLFDFLVQPLVEVWKEDGQFEERRFIFTALHEKFFTDIKVAFFAALFLSFPLVASQVWLFVAPGLYKNEKQAFLPFLVATPVLFFLGGAFVYYFVMPVAWDFFVHYGEQQGAGGPTIQLEAKVGEYLALAMRLIFAFGISFELPVLITLLAKAGMATSTGLRQKRRYAIVLAFVAAAILTPPDPLSQISLAIPIILLYEVSILSARLVEKRREEAEDDWAEEDQGEDDSTASGRAGDDEPTGEDDR